MFLFWFSLKQQLCYKILPCGIVWETRCYKVNFQPAGWIYFGPRVYPKRSFVIALVRVYVCLSVFKYLRDHSLVFSSFCMKLGHHKGTKVTEPDFWKKILGGHKWGKIPIFGAFLIQCSGGPHQLYLFPIRSAKF